MAKKKEDLILNEKEEKIDRLLKEAEKMFGKGSMMKLGDNGKMSISSISSGSINLDIALGVGGYPKGRIIEIYGAESSGKTTLALHAIAEAQKVGGIAAFIDAEHALDPVYAKALGVNIDELLISQPDNGEQALQIAEMLCASGAVDIIVVDSVAALVPKAEIDGEMADQQMGLQARLMSKGLRKLTGTVAKMNTILIFINQIREKIGGFSFMGPQTTTSGGRALKFFSTIRLEVKKTSQIKQGDAVIGNEVSIKVTKNKVAPPFKEAKTAILYGKGISRTTEIFDAALEVGVCSKSGSWFSYGDRKLGQGKQNIEDMLSNDPELLNEIKSKVDEILYKNTEEILEDENNETDEV